jgi:hypothetical protein
LQEFYIQEALPSRYIIILDGCLFLLNKINQCSALSPLVVDWHASHTCLILQTCIAWEATAGEKVYGVNAPMQVQQVLACFDQRVNG